MTDLTPNLPSGFDSFANAINASGVVVGSQLGHAIVWVNGFGTDLNTLIPANSGVTLVAGNGINDKGQIVATGLPAGSTIRGNTHVYLLTPQ